MEVEDWYHPGSMITIPIDPFKGPVDTAQALYKKSQKLKRSADMIRPLKEEAQAELDYLMQIEVGGNT